MRDAGSAQLRELCVTEVCCSCRQAAGAGRAVACLGDTAVAGGERGRQRDAEPDAPVVEEPARRAVGG